LGTTLALRWGYVSGLPPKNFDGEGQAMASLEQRGNGFRIIFRLGGQKHHVGVTATDRRDADDRRR
jgi:hypothetical protein